MRTVVPAPVTFRCHRFVDRGCGAAGCGAKKSRSRWSSTTSKGFFNGIVPDQKMCDESVCDRHDSLSPYSRSVSAAGETSFLSWPVLVCDQLMVHSRGIPDRGLRARHPRRNGQRRPTRRNCRFAGLRPAAGSDARPCESQFVGGRVPGRVS